ncbi:glutamate formimidoyltransferase [candidate division KSB1 bacterium]|nr:glutamate formimidoyltransferase [candidate division KSB1 bacterium]
MDKIVECVPNFSEGRDMGLIDQITAEIKAVKGAKLLNVDPGADTNRTVVTFVGSPEAVVEAAFRATQKAAQLIDMTKHTGAHPRMGATDVCPLIPVSGLSDEECIQLANQLGKRIGETLNIPIYLYGKAAKKPERQQLPDIRQGEYEALPEKLKDPAFAPDFGPAHFNAKSGATVVGVRDFMLAYNVNLNTTDRSPAHDIALDLRESGRAKRDKKGDIIRDEAGNAIKISGKLKFVQGAGWIIEEYGYAQVTMNLHNYHVTGLHTAFEAVREEAKNRGLRVTGSELVGMAPKEALLDAGKFYLRQQGKHIGLAERDIIHIAILSLGLNDTSPFDPNERIIEYAMQEEKDELVNLTVADFVNELASDSPAPGGGSVAALNGALAAALASMVANLTFGKKEYQRHNRLMEQVAIRAQELKATCLQLIDLDSDAFNGFMTALRMPQKSEQEQQARETAKQSAALHMTDVPLTTLRMTRDLLEIIEQVAKKGNSNAISDAGVAALQAEAAAMGAYFNIKINIPQLADAEIRTKITTEAETKIKEIGARKKRVIKQVMKKL